MSQSPEASKGYGRGNAGSGFPFPDLNLITLGCGKMGKGPFSPELLRASDALNPWDTTELSVRKRTSTIDVEEVMAKGTSLPPGGNLQNMIGVAGMCATICMRIQRIQT